MLNVFSVAREQRQYAKAQASIEFHITSDKQAVMSSDVTQYTDTLRIRCDTEVVNSLKPGLGRGTVRQFFGELVGSAEPFSVQT
jgi:hypothetical protein